MEFLPYIMEARLMRRGDERGYPYNIPAIAGLSKLSFSSPVTFFVGKNGSGKSTLLEAIAVAYGFNPEGGSKNMSFETYKSHSELWQKLKLIKGPHHPRDGYFLRTESFYNVASYIEELDAVPAYAAPVKEAYGGNLHERSHGESFAALIFKRLHGKGMYIFDEPEAALSAESQLAVLSRMKELADDGSQFIIATHSPIILAYPGATIYSFGEGGVKEAAYEETDIYHIYKYFMNNRSSFLRELGF